MVIEIRDVAVRGSDVVAVGKFGHWEAELVMGPEEVKSLIPLALKGGVVGYAFKLPFLKTKKKGA